MESLHNVPILPDPLRTVQADGRKWIYFQKSSDFESDMKWQKSQMPNSIKCMKNIG